MNTAISTQDTAHKNIRISQCTITACKHTSAGQKNLTRQAKGKFEQHVFYTKALFLEKHHGGSKQRERKDKKTEMSFLVGGSKKTTW